MVEGSTEQHLRGKPTQTPDGAERVRTGERRVRNEKEGESERKAYAI